MSTACDPPSTADSVVPVPSVVGMDSAEAKATLEQLGFEVRIVDQTGEGTGVVRRQKPAAGYLAWNGTGTMTLVVTSRS
jgi:beta-lactam-binding protein with PASTA domain